MSCRKGACNTVERLAKIILAPALGFPCMHSHTYTQRSHVGIPWLCMECPLEGHCRRDGSSCCGKRSVKSVANRLKDYPTLSLQTLTHQLIMTCERKAHLFRIAFPAHSTPLDISKKKCNGPGW